MTRSSGRILWGTVAAGLVALAFAPAAFAQSSGEAAPAGVPAGTSAATPAAPAGPADLTLTTGEVDTDPSGAFITVSVANGSQTTYNKVVVTCAFYDGDKAVGVSSTTLFSLVGGNTGSDQVRLMGAAAATSANCRITRAK